MAATLSDERSFALWYGPHPNEFLFALRACWCLQRVAGRLHEVRLPPHPTLEPFYGSIGVAGPDGVAAAWPSIRRLDGGEVKERAERWADLRAHPNHAFRVMTDWRFSVVPVDYYDAHLVAQCSSRWRSSSLVVAGVFASHPIGDQILAWRVRGLLDSGQVEGRGTQTGLQLPSEIRLRQTS